MIFVGYPGHQRAKVSELAKFGRPVCSALIYSAVGIPRFVGCHLIYGFSGDSSSCHDNVSISCI